MIKSCDQQSDTTLRSCTPMIQYAEVWVPSDDRSFLQRQSTVRSGSETQRARSDSTPAMADSGLVFSTAQSKSVTILQEEPSHLLDQISEQAEIDLNCVVTIPVCSRQQCRGVVVLGLGTGYGAAELWQRDDRDELAVKAAHYSGLPSFEFITRHTKFPKGAGVPGRVWSGGRAIIGNNLQNNASFIRSFGNDPATVTDTVGIPVGLTGGYPKSVLLLLSTLQSPLAREVQLWSYDTPLSDETEQSTIPSDRSLFQSLTSESFFSGSVQQEGSNELGEPWQQATIETVCHSGVPAVIDRPDILPDGATANLAIPVFCRSGLSSIVNMLF